MDSIDRKEFAEALKYLFDETFAGSFEQGSVYLDSGVGIFHTIERLPADKASKSIAGANVAAQTDHLRYYLDVLNNFLNGRVQFADWNNSWRIKEVTEEEWTEIRNKLQKSFETVQQTFAEKEEWNKDGLVEAMAMIVHSAYHLGAIRQLIKHL